jgi:hypothetical protein
MVRFDFDSFLIHTIDTAREMSTTTTATATASTMDVKRGPMLNQDQKDTKVKFALRSGPVIADVVDDAEESSEDSDIDDDSVAKSNNGSASASVSASSSSSWSKHKPERSGGTTSRSSARNQYAVRREVHRHLLQSFSTIVTHLHTILTTWGCTSTWTSTKWASASYDALQSPFSSSTSPFSSTSIRGKLAIPVTTRTGKPLTILMLSTLGSTDFEMAVDCASDSHPYLVIYDTTTVTFRDENPSMRKNTLDWMMRFSSSLLFLPTSSLMFPYLSHDYLVKNDCRAVFKDEFNSYLASRFEPRIDRYPSIRSQEPYLIMRYGFEVPEMVCTASPSFSAGISYYYWSVDGKPVTSASASSPPDRLPSQPNDS